MDYKEKYLKYKNKYLKLKYGGDNVYVNNQYRDFSLLKSTEKPEINNNLKFRDFSGLKSIKNYYINIKLNSDLFSKELARKLDENGFHKIEKNNLSDKYEKVRAEIIFVYNHDGWPTRKLDETVSDYRNRLNKSYLNLFPIVEWVDYLYGDFKEKITYKLNFHKNFGYLLRNYLAPWRAIEYDKTSHIIKESDLQQISFSNNSRLIIKANNGIKRYGTKVFENSNIKDDIKLREEIREHIKYFNDNLLRDSKIRSPDHSEVLKPNGWIVEDYINTDKTKDNRSFFIRVHILVVSKRKNKYSQIENTAYISKKQPYIIMKDTDECRHSPHIYDCTDNLEGSHVLNSKNNNDIITGGGTNGYRDKDNNEILYKFDRNLYWPKYTPDMIDKDLITGGSNENQKYSESDIQTINNQIIDLGSNIFSKENIKNMKPIYNSLNGYEIFGLDISFKNKNIILHEINRRTGLDLITPFIDDLISVMNYNLPIKEFNLLTK